MLRNSKLIKPQQVVAGDIYSWNDFTSRGLYALCSISRWRLELSIFKDRIIVFILCVMIQFIHAMFNNIAYLRHVPDQTLKDAGFELIPALPDSLRWISELIFFFILTTAICMSFITFFRARPQYYAATVWIRVLFVMGICILLRCITYLSTSLPGPAPHCQPGSLTYSPPKSWKDIIFHIDALHGCGDLIFSSHTCLAICFILALHTYLKYYISKNKYNLIMYGLYWPLIVLMIIFIIAARKHYTVDVVVASYTTPLIWNASYRLMDDYPNNNNNDITTTIDYGYDDDDYHNEKNRKNAEDSQRLLTASVQLQLP